MIIFNSKKIKNTFIFYTITKLLFVITLWTGFIHITPEESLNEVGAFYIILICINSFILGVSLVDNFFTIKENLVQTEAQNKLREVLKDKVFKNVESEIFKDYRLNTLYYKYATVIYILMIVAIIIPTLFVNNYVTHLHIYCLIMALNFGMYLLCPLKNWISLNKKTMNKLFEVVGYTDKESFIKLINLANMSSKIRDMYLNGHTVTLEYKVKENIEQILLNKEYQNVITYEITKLEDFINSIKKDFTDLEKNKNDRKSQSSMKEILDICLSLQNKLLIAFESIENVDINKHINTQSKKDDQDLMNEKYKDFKQIYK